ncbi:ankyrin repeat domain-containing protein [Streptomyces javensis]|uniref:ankyrin repeat domain-containing protein n=1 Tax=Streptomyces javensis TaxID=114698 RepID=UPI0031F8FBD3
MTDWQDIHDWTDPRAVRAALAAGADPDRVVGGHMAPLHSAACSGSAEVLAELLTVAREVDQPDAAGRTPLWHAVRNWDREKASALIAAGADPWRPREVDGRSPGELAWWTPLADLVAGVPGAREPAPGERAAQRAADALIAAFDAEEGEYQDWGCVAFVAGRSVPEVVAALGGDIVATIGEDEDEDEDGDENGEEDGEADYADVLLEEEGRVLVGAAPGGVVLQQFDGIAIHGEEVLAPLSRGTVAVSVFDHPDAFIRPSIARDGVMCPCEEVMLDPEQGDPEEAWRYRFGDGGHPSGWTARALAMAAAVTGVAVDGGPRWIGRPGSSVILLPERLRN